MKKKNIRTITFNKRKCVFLILIYSINFDFDPRCLNQLIKSPNFLIYYIYIIKMIYCHKIRRRKKLIFINLEFKDKFIDLKNAD